MRLLITGAAGMLGQDVALAARDAGHDPLVRSHAELDITDRGAVAAAVAQAEPEVVINCAAYTNVDGAESEALSANAINATGAGNVAAASAQAGAWTIQVSSDYVFDGRKRTPYVESDQPAPLSCYGSSKLAGEQAVSAAAPASHTIVRTAWLYGTHGHCFPATILRLAAQRSELTVVDDQVGSPTFTAHLAGALVAIAASRPAGIIHVAASDHGSWFEFAREIVSAANLTCDVQPGRTEDLGRPAPRPAYSVLGTSRPDEAPSLPSWREGLREYLAAGVAAS